VAFRRFNTVDQYLIFQNIIDRLEAILSVCFELFKENINNIVQNNYTIILIVTL